MKHRDIAYIAVCIMAIVVISTVWFWNPHYDNVSGAYLMVDCDGQWNGTISFENGTKYYYDGVGDSSIELPFGDLEGKIALRFNFIKVNTTVGFLNLTVQSSDGTPIREFGAAPGCGLASQYVRFNVAP